MVSNLGAWQQQINTQTIDVLLLHPLLHPLLLQVSPCLSVLSWLLFVNDTDILADACWALSYLSDGPNDKIQAVIDSGVCRRLVELLL